MKKICFTLTAAVLLSMFASISAFAAPTGTVTTLPNGDRKASFSLGGGSSGSDTEAKVPASNGGGTSPTGERYLTHDEVIQLGRDMAAEYGLEWYGQPKKTFDMSVSAQGTKEQLTSYYDNMFSKFVEEGYDAIYIEIFHDGNEYVLRIYR